jgi:hypothetical protein
VKAPKIKAVSRADELWHRVQADLTPDGALRDIYVQDTTINDWQKVLELVRTDYAPVNFRTSDGIGSASSEVLLQHFGSGPASADFLFEVGPVSITAYLFEPRRIELSFAPHEVRSSDELEALLAFLARIGTTLCRPVHVTHENMPETVFLRFDPDTNTVYFIPPPHS